MIRTNWPNLGGRPKTKFETYGFPSGPKVIAVGKTSPDATMVSVQH